MKKKKCIKMIRRRIIQKRGAEPGKKWLIGYDRYDTTIYISKINY